MGNLEGLGDVGGRGVSLGVFGEVLVRLMDAGLRAGFWIGSVNLGDRDQRRRQELIGFSRYGWTLDHLRVVDFGKCNKRSRSRMQKKMERSFCRLS